MNKILCVLVLFLLVNTVSASTLLVYPTEDAYPERNVAAGESWASLRGGAGTGVGATTTVDAVLYTYSSSNKWNIIRRGAIIFNTSALTADATISSAKIGLNFTQVQDEIVTHKVGITKFVIDGGIDAADYNNFEDTLLTDELALADIVLDGNYDNFTVNSLGISNISKTGLSGFFVRIDADYTNVEPSPWAASKNIRGKFTDSSSAGSDDPFIEIEYTTGSPPVSQFTASSTFISRPHSVTFTDTSLNIPTSWTWSMGDGSANITTQDVTYTYKRPGIFTVGQTATNALGSSSNQTTVRVIVGGYQVSPEDTCCSCKDKTYGVSRDLNSIEKIDTDIKIYLLCEGYDGMDG